MLGAAEPGRAKRASPITTQKQSTNSVATGSLINGGLHRAIDIEECRGIFSIYLDFSGFETRPSNFFQNAPLTGSVQWERPPCDVRTCSS